MCLMAEGGWLVARKRRTTGFVVVGLSSVVHQPSRTMAALN
jgi:hypothetical protein